MQNAGQTAHEWDVMEPDLRSSYILYILIEQLFLHRAGINIANYYFISGNKIVQLDK